MRSPYIELGGDFDDYLVQNFGRKHRYNIRRTARILRENPDCRVVRFSRRDEMLVALELAFRVSKASWKGTTNSDMAGSEARKAFYVDVTNHLAEEGLVQIWLLELAGCPIAVQYQLISHKAVHLLVSDFDENNHDLSPGTALLYRVIEQLHKEDIKEFDFCGDAYEYKMEWATGIRQHVNIQLFNSNWYSRFIFITKTRILPLFRMAQDRTRRFCPSFIHIPEESSVEPKLME